MLLQDECGYTGSLSYRDEQRNLAKFVDLTQDSVWGSGELSFGTNCVVDGTLAHPTPRGDQIWGVDYYLSL